MSSCSECGAPLETPIACAACGAIQSVPDDATPFALFALEPGHAIDERDLRRRSTRFARLVHPDFHAAADASTRARAEALSARLNRAFDVLSDAARRADWLVVHRGGPTEESERAMPAAFLMEVLEWNELLEEARAATVHDPRVDDLAVELARRREAGLAALAKLLAPLPERASPRLADARRELNALRYLDRALREIESLRLARAERR